MRVLGLLSRKGGTGKTTLAVHLATLAQAAGRHALLVDRDPQRSAKGWWRVREAKTPLLLEASADRLGEMLNAARTEAIDLAVIDTRSLVADDAAQVVALADLILVPTRPGIRPAGHPRHAGYGEGLGQALDDRAQRLPAATRDDRGDRYWRCTASSDRFGVPVPPVAIVNRTRFSTSQRAGLTACEADPDSKAAKEMRALWRVVEKELPHEKAC
jgi:chromosome partitioning protein